MYTNGALGTITATTCADKDYPFRLEIIGTAGRATLEQNAITQWEADTAPEEIELTDDDHRLVDEWVPNEQWGLAHRRQLQLILDCIAEGRQPYVAGQEARAAVDIILGIYRNANG